MSQSEEKKWLSLADLEQDPKVQKFREEEARAKRGQRDLLIEQAGEVLDSPAALADVIKYINREHKQGTLDYDQVSNVLLFDPVRLVRIARQVVGKKERKSKQERKVPGFDLKKVKEEQLKGLFEF